MSTSGEGKHIVGLSGGKDSTALAVLLKEREPRPYEFFITPTGDELPEMLDHWKRLEEILETPLTVMQNGTLNELIAKYKALPNHRMRWCTRILKIEPCLRYMKQYPGSTLYVGLRADEPLRQGIYDSAINTRFPLREWGMGVDDVLRVLKERRITIPERTDCARCYAQRKSEWEKLYWRQPAIFADAKGQEKATGHTFKWGTSLEEMEQAFVRKGRPYKQLKMAYDDDEQEEIVACRVCSL